MDLFPKRMFICLPVAAPGVEKAGVELEKSASCLKLVHGKNYHITLKFLGDIGQAVCSAFVTTLDSSSRPQKVECMIKGLGCFPGVENPSVIWAGMEYDSRIMDELFNFGEDAAVTAGLAPERKNFIPHLTLARVRRGTSVPPALKDYIKANRETLYDRCVLDRVVLFESVLKKNGPEYKVYKQWELA